MSLFAAFKSAGKRLARPIWRRMWSRIEQRVAPLADRTSLHDVQIAQLQEWAQVMTEQHGSLEGAWRQHLPSFLNAISSVAAFGFELAAVRRELSERTRSIEALTSDQHREMKDREDAMIELRRQLEDGRGAMVDTRREIAASLEMLTWLRQDLDRSKESANGKEAAAQRTAEELAKLWSAAEKAQTGIGDLWHRLEFVRKEIMYEISFGHMNSDSSAKTLAQILSPEKVLASRANGIKLNLGCGHIPLEGYINVDQRILPGVDIVSDAGDLPFEKESVQEIRSAHLLEHFPEEKLRRLLPYWRMLLAPKGSFCAIVPDGEAMILEMARGTYPFEEFREVLFGAQEYNGDFHFNLLTPESLTRLLNEAGFTKIKVPAHGRRNGSCFEFEIHAVRG
jgi:predicted SAM-dependent methyltransferase